ncbi:ATP-binding protein [Actinoplanes sp. NPDC049265]|uniref:sensor histidine kinase n=1 Tax=Actinoplanes sp. NPDC049265 TaxID=3363902 RepID=UPI00372306D1
MAPASDHEPLPSQLIWLIALPSVAAVTLFAVTMGYLRGRAEQSTFYVPYLVAIASILIAAAFAIRLARRAFRRATELRVAAVAANSALAGAHAELAAAQSELDQLEQSLHEAEGRPAKAAAAQSQAAGRQVEVFVNLSRRLQSLVHREIKLLDALENEVEDPDLLKGLFQVDHLATRIRRHAENLAVLGGSVSRRQWSRPVALTEVLRSAIAEVEHYSRVKLVPPIEGTIPGHAVASVIHLVAELIENATMFAPPQTNVVLRVEQVAVGLAIEVEDRGLGIQRADQDRLNQLLTNPEDINLDDLLRDGRIGLFVVSMIARQHGILVRLQNNIYGGTQAVVILPQVLLGSASEPEPEPERPARPHSLSDHTIEFAQHGSWPAFEPATGTPRPRMINGSQPSLDAVNGSGPGPAQVNGGQPGLDGRNGGQPGPRSVNGSLAGPNPVRGSQAGPNPVNGSLTGPNPVNGNQAGPYPANGNQPAPYSANGNQIGPPAVNGNQTGLHAVNGRRRDHQPRQTPPHVAEQPPVQPPAQRPALPQQPQSPMVPPMAGRPPLPRRRSQTHMAPQLQQGPPRPPQDPAGEHDTGLMASFMNGVSMGEADDPQHPDYHG